MRGVFTSGVLDWMMDNGIRFPYVIGVSAGACNGASYISNQRGRAKFSNIDLLETYRYVGWKHFFKKKNIMDFDLLFDEFPHKILPYDFETYAQSEQEFEIVTSNCLTGKAEYHREKTDHFRFLDLLRASSSMPFFSPIAYVDGIPMLDGGICDSIPVERCMEKGFEQMVVVLTRNKGYRKKDTPRKIPSFIFKKYPNMREALLNRSSLYNRQLDLVDELEAAGKAIVIRPLEPITIGRLEQDIDKLTHFYNHGYECAEKLKVEG